MVSGPELADLFGQPAAAIPDDQPQWDHVAHDLGELVAAILLTVSAEKVVLGGSVALGRASLLDRVRKQVVATLGAYLPHINERTIADLLVLSQLQASAGPLGAITLAKLAATDKMCRARRRS